LKIRKFLREEDQIQSIGLLANDQTGYNLWVLLSEAFIKLGLHEEANQCIAEARLSYTNPADISYNEGLLAESKHDKNLAKENFKKAITFNDLHIEALLKYGELLLKEENYFMADHNFHRVLRIDPLNSQAWKLLGRSQQRQGNLEKATDSLLVAAQLYETEPVISFQFLPKIM